MRARGRGSVFGVLRRRHREILEAVAALEAAVGSMEAAAALARFLEFADRTLLPHLRNEEREVFPLLERHLDGEAGSGGTMLREHDTVRGLIALLRQSGPPAAGGAGDPDLAVTVQDLALVLRDHIRKEDGVVHPLLQRLLTPRARRAQPAREPVGQSPPAPGRRSARRLPGGSGS